jgi:hypothetical protein
VHPRFQSFSEIIPPCPYETEENKGVMSWGKEEMNRCRGGGSRGRNRLKRMEEMGGINERMGRDVRREGIRKRDSALGHFHYHNLSTISAVYIRIYK